jgi:hypothetical protein
MRAACGAGSNSQAIPLKLEVKMALKAIRRN